MMWLLTAFGAVRRLVQGAFDLARRHPWPALVIALLLALAWTWHGRSTARDERDSARAALVDCNDARAIERKSIATLTAALNDQSARVHALGEASAKRQNAAQIALGRAVERAKASEATAVRIERTAPTQGCVTSPEVLGAGL